MLTLEWGEPEPPRPSLFTITPQGHQCVLATVATAMEQGAGFLCYLLSGLRVAEQWVLKKVSMAACAACLRERERERARVQRCVSKHATKAPAFTEWDTSSQYRRCLIGEQFSSQTQQQSVAQVVRLTQRDWSGAWHVTSK